MPVTGGRTLSSHPTASAPADGLKLAAQTARRIEDGIIAAGWPIDQVFGSESDLMHRYGVSRAVLREAIRLVEHHGVARMRRGPSGGLIVCKPDATAVVSAVTVYLDHVGTTVDDLICARRILEPLAVSIAAQRITEDEIRELRSSLEAHTEENSCESVVENDQAVHLAIATFSHNDALVLFIEVLLELTGRYGMMRPKMASAELANAANQMHQVHRRLASEVISGNGEAARQLADAHLETIQKYYLQPGRRRRPTSFDASLAERQDKLAELTARNLQAALSELKLPVGTVIGSEPELIERFRVSRAVFREAVRLLEHHSIATMRRGPGGGLVITRPDPRASIEAAALYLQYHGTTARDLNVVRQSLELGVIDLLSTRPPDNELAATMRAEMALLEETEELREHVGSFHPRLGDFAGNPILALLLRITLELWSRNGELPSGVVPDSRNRLEAAVTAHDSIVAAIADRDYDLARHRMSRHLDALVGFTEW
jgi:DNA-binding FadR family transcriptional regulator